MKKKKLIAVSLSLALMPGLLYAAPEEGQDNIEMKVNLENVTALTEIFAGRSLRMRSLICKPIRSRVK